MNTSAHATSAHAVVRALRPRQWLKNVLVGAAPLAAGVVARPDVLWRVALLFCLLCAVSGAGYLVNDIRDVDYDRQHPEKRLRPIASGAVSIRYAGIMASALVCASFTLAVVIFGLNVLIGLIAYIAVSMSYSFGIKNVAGVEMLFVAMGFVIRAVLGGMGTNTRLSAWFLVFIGVAALLVVVGKRQSELARLDVGGQAAAVPARTALRSYSSRYLQGLAWLSAVVAVGAYVMWAVTRGVLDDEPVLLIASSIPLAASVRRYLQLIAAGKAETPEEALIADRFIVFTSVMWFALFAAAVALGS